MTTTIADDLVSGTEALIAPIVERINAGWAKSTEAVIEVAKELAQAKKTLGKDGFNFLCNSTELKITRRTIDKLVMIGEWKYIDDSFIQASMPSAVLTYLIAKMYSTKSVYNNIAETVALSTFLSFFTLPIVVFISLKYFT